MSEKIHCDGCDKVLQPHEVENLKLLFGGMVRSSRDVSKQYCHSCMVNIVHENPWFEQFFPTTYWKKGDNGY